MYAENTQANKPNVPNLSAMLGITVAIIVASTAAMKVAAMHAARIKGRRMTGIWGASEALSSDMVRKRLSGVRGSWLLSARHMHQALPSPG
jgi:hypothetical protein